MSLEFDETGFREIVQMILLKDFTNCGIDLVLSQDRGLTYFLFGLI